MPRGQTHDRHECPCKEGVYHSALADVVQDGMPALSRLSETVCHGYRSQQLTSRIQPAIARP